MKKLTLFIFTSLSIMTLAHAEAQIFTTLATANKDIFAGVKLEKKGMEPDTYLIQVTSKLISNKISLPRELTHREVVAILETKTKELVVVTQRTVEQGDKPQLHSLNPVTKKWKKLGVADCESFAKLKVESSSLSFACVETNAKGEEVESQKTVNVKGVTFAHPGEIGLPVSKVEIGNLKAELLGESFEWKELKVAQDKNVKTFKP